MNIKDIPFNTVDWDKIPATEHRGANSVSLWKTVEQGNVRIRIAEHKPGFLAGDWCLKGHIVYVLSGEMTMRIKDGRTFRMREGMSFQVSDGIDEHQSYSESGCRLFIVD